MRLVRVRSLDGKADSRYQKREIDNKLECQDNLRRLGEQFISDKESLEKKMEEVQESDMDELTKIGALDVLEEKLARIKEQYEKAVVEEEERCRERDRREHKGSSDDGRKYSEQADNIKDWKSEATGEDIQDVTDELEKKRDELEQMKQDYVDQLSLRIQQANIQMRQMRAQGIQKKKVIR